MSPRPPRAPDPTDADGPATHRAAGRVRPFLLAALIAPLAAGACGEPPAAPEPPIPHVKVFVVGERATGQARRISGKVVASERTALSFGVRGRVAETIVEDGQAVAAGQLLARLDDEPLRLEQEKVRARVASANAELVEARAAFERTSGLVERKAAPRKDLEAATRRLATAEADAAAAQRSLDQSGLDLARARLTAPFAGQVAAVRVDAFQEVGATDVAVEMLAEGALEVDVRVPETLIRDVDLGQVVEVAFPTLEGVTLPGEVTSIGAEVGSGNAFPVAVRLRDAPAADVRPGMTASVTFRFDAYLDGRVAYLIPISALALDAGLGAAAPEASEGNRAPVFVHDAATGRVALRRVLVGELRGNEVEVFEGLAPGDRVVCAGVPFLSDGMAAKVWTPRRQASQ